MALAVDAHSSSTLAFCLDAVSSFLSALNSASSALSPICLSSTVLGPVALAYSRHNEHEADRFALELTRTNRSAARAFVDLQTANLGVPRHSLVDTLWRATHPSIAERIEFANTYRPWAEGRPTRYGDRFGPPVGTDAE